MTLASHLGMSLQECMEKHTYREYLMWMVWLDEKGRETSLDHWYLMQVAAEVRRAFSKRSRSVKLKHFELQFETAISKEIHRVSQAKRSKATWLAMFGGTLEKPPANYRPPPPKPTEADLLKDPWL